MPKINARGISVYYEDVGRGAPMVLLGGTLGTARGDFSPQIEAFASSYRVIAPERRGYGGTRPPERDYPDDFYQRDANDVAAFMHALDLSPAALLGWSEGADVAMCLAAENPDKVSSLVVWGGIAEVTGEDIAVFEARRDVATWPRKARAAMTAAYGESYWQSTWEKWCDSMQRLHAQGGNVHLAPLEKIACPTLVLHGANDPLIRSAHPIALHGRISGSHLQMIDESGHNPHLTHAVEFNRLVLDFIERSRHGTAEPP
jgi:valacyclovir hydrolase